MTFLNLKVLKNIMTLLVNLVFMGSLIFDVASHFRNNNTSTFASLAFPYFKIQVMVFVN
jgi:hypothetical protein